MKILLVIALLALSGCATNNDIVLIQGQLDEIKHNTTIVSIQSKNTLLSSVDIIESASNTEQLLLETTQLMKQNSNRIDMLKTLKFKAYFK
jgi:hypothetical protein